jgi:predicted transporter
VSTAVLVVSAALLILAGLLIYQGWQCYRRKQITKAAFLGGLALSPVIFTTIVLGVTYL